MRTTLVPGTRAGVAVQGPRIDPGRPIDSLAAVRKAVVVAF